MARLFDDASSQYLEAAVAVLTATPITMACFFQSDDLVTGQTLMELGVAGSFDNRFTLGASGDLAGDPVGAFTRTTATSSATTTTGYSANTRHHACGVWASATSRAAYIDGGSKGTNTTSRVPSGINTTPIGRSAGNGAYMSGRICEAAIWNVALTDAQVAQLARGICPLRIRTGALLAYWPLFGNASPEVNFAQGSTTFNLTVTGATQADHYGVMPPFGFDMGWQGAFTAAVVAGKPWHYYQKMRQAA